MGRRSSDDVVTTGVRLRSRATVQLTTLRGSQKVTAFYTLTRIPTACHGIREVGCPVEGCGLFTLNSIVSGRQAIRCVDPDSAVAQSPIIKHTWIGIRALLDPPPFVTLQSLEDKVALPNRVSSALLCRHETQSSVLIFHRLINVALELISWRCTCTVPIL